MSDDDIVFSLARVQAAVAQADVALASPRAKSLKSALAALEGVEAWGETLASVAEDGRATELAARIPGARCVDGMLALSEEHTAWLERASARAAALRLATEALRKEKRRAGLARALDKHASGAEPLTLDACRALASAFYDTDDRAAPLAADVAASLAPLCAVLAAWPGSPEALFEIARASWVDVFPSDAFERASAAGSLAATHALLLEARRKGDALAVARLEDRAIDQGDAYRPFEHAVTLAGRAADRAQAFALFVRIARALPRLPVEPVLLDRYVLAATRAIAMMRAGLMPADAALELELVARRAPHTARFGAAITATNKLFGLR